MITHVEELLAEARGVVALHAHAKAKYHLDQTVNDVMLVPMPVLVTFITDAQRDKGAIDIRRRWNLSLIGLETTALDETMRVPAQLVIDLIEYFHPDLKREAVRARAEAPGWKATHREKPKYLKPGLWLGPVQTPRTITGRRPTQPAMQRFPVKKTETARKIREAFRGTHAPKYLVEALAKPGLHIIVLPSPEAVCWLQQFGLTHYLCGYCFGHYGIDTSVMPLWRASHQLARAIKRDSDMHVLVLLPEHLGKGGFEAGTHALASTAMVETADTVLFMPGPHEFKIKKMRYVAKKKPPRVYDYVDTDALAKDHPF